MYFLFADDQSILHFKNWSYGWTNIIYFLVIYKEHSLHSFTLKLIGINNLYLNFQDTQLIIKYKIIIDLIYKKKSIINLTLFVFDI